MWLGSQIDVPIDLIVGAYRGYDDISSYLCTGLEHYRVLPIPDRLPVVFPDLTTNLIQLYPDLLRDLLTIWRDFRFKKSKSEHLRH